jgi:apolipoprotein D and lipocalin family protein
MRQRFFPVPSRLALAAAVMAGLALAPAQPAHADSTPVHGSVSVPLQPYAHLDLTRYSGRWYEIARFPNRHQRGCAAVTAEYEPRPDGNYAVRGVCPDAYGRDRPTVREGVARLDGPAELSVGINSWLPVFRRSVFVLDVSEDYGVAVIGEPRRKYGWIMARRPELSRAEFDRAAEVLARNGYWVDLLEPVAPVR